MFKVFSYLFSKSGVEEQNDHKNVNKIVNHSLKRTTTVSFNFFPPKTKTQKFAAGTRYTYITL